MKKTLAIALLLAGNSALASVARINALQNPIHIQDFQTVFHSSYTRASDIMLLPEMMEINFGYSTPDAAPGDAAQGGMIRALGDARLGFYVGTVKEARSNNYLGVENPFTVVYGAKAGDLAWGVAFSYSNSDKKATTATTDDQKQSYMSLAGSVAMGDMIFGADLGLTDTADGDGANETVKYKNAPMSVFGQYAMGEWTAYGRYSMGTKTDDSTGSEVKTETSNLTIGALNSTKKEGADFFYGVSYVMASSKEGTNVKQDTMRLPVLIGIEADAASWLTLRASVTQNVLLGTVKATETDTVAHNTLVAAGAGLKFDRALVDFTLTAAQTGNLNANSLGAQAALAYTF